MNASTEALLSVGCFPLNFRMSVGRELVANPFANLLTGWFLHSCQKNTGDFQKFLLIHLFQGLEKKTFWGWVKVALFSFTPRRMHQAFSQTSKPPMAYLRLLERVFFEAALPTGQRKSFITCGVLHCGLPY